MIIALAGKAGSGKSTIAKALAEALSGKPYRGIDCKAVKVGSFAEPMKIMIKDLLDYAGAQVPEKTENFLFTDKTYRYVLQTIGTEWGRDLVDKDFWAKILKMKFVDKDIPVVVDDLRFLNELRVVKSAPVGITFYLMRDALTIVESSHISENGLVPEDCDFVLNNNRPVEDVISDMLLLVEHYVAS